MRWLPVAVLCSGWAWAGMEATPVGQPARGVLGLAIGCSCLLAWWVGRRSGRAAAYTAAVATAEARAAAAAQSSAAAQSLVVVNVADGAQTRAAAQYGGLDSAPWIGAPKTAALEQDSGLTITAEGVISEVVE